MDPLRASTHRLNVAATHALLFPTFFGQTVRCNDCDRALYCNRCFREVHLEDSECAAHVATKYTTPPLPPLPDVPSTSPGGPAANAAAAAAAADTAAASVPTESAAPPPVRVVPAPTEADAPDEYRCPLTLELMTDPVVAMDGNTYERAAIAEWLDVHTTSPLTREEIQPVLVTNMAIRKLIEAHRSQVRQANGTCLKK